MEENNKKSKVLKKCSKCGYEAILPNDPLITAYNNIGECPSCKTIDKKSNRKKPRPEVHAPETPVIEELPKKIIPKPLIFTLIFVFALILLHFLLGGSEKAEDALPRKTISRHTETHINGSSEIEISSAVLPGETKNVKIISYLSFFHVSNYSTLDVELKLNIKKAWEEEGLTIEIVNYELKPETIELWEFCTIGGSLWQPNIKYHAHSSGSYYKQVEPDKDLLISSQVYDIVTDPEPRIPPNNTQGNPTRQNTYTVYRLETTLAISLPPGDEFKARELTSVRNDGKIVPRAYIEQFPCLEISPSIRLDFNYEYMTGQKSQAGSGGPSRITDLGTLKRICFILSYKNNKQGIYILKNHSADNHGFMIL